MPIKMKYRCNNCGERFEIDILTEDEKREFERQRLNYTPISCPKCHRRDYREGWE